MRYSKTQIKHFSLIGKKGGQKNKEKGFEYFSRIGKMGVLAKKKKNEE